MVPHWFSLAAQAFLLLVPALCVLAVVFKQSKLMSSFAQLGGLQERDHTRRSISQKAIEVDKLWFILGVLNTSVVPYILGAFPVYYYLFFTPKIISLILIRLVTFYKKKQHFLLWDFCYWANFLCLFYCWCMPDSPTVFRAAFMCANGPLAWSVLAFNHALIFHSYAHVTSAAVHFSPLVLTYGLRWYAAPVGHGLGSKAFRVCEVSDCSDGTFSSLVGGTLVHFYLWWLALYYVWIFVALGSYIEQNSYQTLWDRILVMKPVGPLLKRLLQRFPKLLVQLVYLLIHLVFSTATMCIAFVLWHSQLANFAFMCAIALSMVKNAAAFYFEMFEGYYNQILEGRADDTSLSKKVIAASPTLASGVPLTHT